MTRFNYPDIYRVLELPSFPLQADENGQTVEPVPNRFSSDELLGGFLVGPENRLAELAYRLAVDGTPVFDRPIGATALEPVETAMREPSRADIEFLFRAAQEGKTDALFDRENATSSPASPLFDMARFNATSNLQQAPKILGYRRLEDLDYLSPLVFYGPSGSGKTRVIEGICQRRRVLEPRKTLYYLSASDFARSLADAIRRRQTELFRSLFAQARVIAIEDADLLSERESAQEEFLPILDAAIRAKKLVILSFSRNPATIHGLLPDLAARLASGLLIPTNSPTEETQRVVVDRVVDKLMLPMTDEMRELCAQRLPPTIGAICAALVQVASEAAMTKTPLSIESLDNFFVRRKFERTWSLDRIVKTVAKYFAIPVSEMRSKKRTKTLVLARKCVVFFARQLTDATYQEIGRQFSNRDHSTMIHATNGLEKALRKDKELKFHLHEIARLLKAENYLFF
ncbi:MAG: helix-turn-helix domain-containing protein [Thermoguttaceae bacterium]